MKNARCFFFIIAVILILPASLGALDFGLITSQYAGFYDQFGGEGIGEDIFEYKGNYIARLSGLIGDRGEFIISAGLSFGAKDEFYFVPELLRTELNLRFGGSALRAGRIYYSDPLGFIAGGLFDGVQFLHNSAAGIFGAGVWYTGLLYKETAYITMTDNDVDIYNAELDYGDFANTYFAPKRLLMSLDWEHPSIAEFFFLKAALTSQVDLTDTDVKLHSQYLTVKASFPAKSLLFEIGGGLELMQTVLADDSKFTMAFAGDFGVFWTPPSNIHSRFSFTGHIAGGGVDDFIGAFVPVTTKVFGGVFQPKLSALSILTLNYAARLGDTIGMGLSALCFIRNDLGTYAAYPVSKDSEGYFLGTEFFASLIWSPASDLQFNIGGGVFLPALGDVEPQEQALWRAKITMTLAIF